jgi:hypothetical protein
LKGLGNTRSISFLANLSDWANTKLNSSTNLSLSETSISESGIKNPFSSPLSKVKEKRSIILIVVFTNL